MTLPSKDADERRALLLQYATIAWNAGEAALTLTLGVLAASLALIGFGGDSLIEIFTSLVVIWHMRRPPEDRASGAKRKALQLVALAFLLLAVALSAAAARDLLSHRRPDSSLPGIIYLGVTAVVMFALAAAKRRLARRTGSAPLRAEATMTFLDGILAVATLTGLGLNAWLGWWWADPGAALVVAVAALNEARELREEAGSVRPPPSGHSSR